MAIKKNQCHLVEYIQSVNEPEFAEIAFNNFLSSSGYNALGLAAKLGDLPILEILVKFNLKNNKTREMPLGNLIKGLTVLDIASQYSHDRTLEIIKVLLNKYRIGNKGGELLGRNSACYAVENLHVQNLAVLMKHGVDVSGTIHYLHNIRASPDEDPSKFMENLSKLINLLKSANPPLNFNETHPTTKKTPLESCISTNNGLVIKSFLQEIYDLKITDNAWAMASQLKDSGIALTILANMLNRANKFYSSNKITDADNLYNLAFENLNILG